MIQAQVLVAWMTAPHSASRIVPAMGIGGWDGIPVSSADPQAPTQRSEGIHPQEALLFRQGWGSNPRMVAFVLSTWKGRVRTARGSPPACRPLTVRPDPA